jgi:hypothetical protein
MSTFSYTQTDSFTITHARYITSKIATDLRQLSAFYALVPAYLIDSFAEEAALLLKDGYLESVEYGFKKADKVIFCLRYEANDGVLSADNAPGRIPANLDIANATWYTYLRYSSKFSDLSASSQLDVKKKLPLQRSTADEPKLDFWTTWDQDKVYSAGGKSVTRKRLKPFFYD